MMKKGLCLTAAGDNCLDVYLTHNQLMVGGNALNVAVQWHNLAQRSGFDIRYFGAVGQDREAGIVRNAIIQAGLDVGGVETLSGQTAITVLGHEAGERRFLVEDLGVGEHYIPNDDHYRHLLASDFVHLGTYADKRLVRRLVKDGVRFSLDLSTRHFELDITGVTLILASGYEDPSQPVAPLIDALRQRGGQRILVTCGGRGAFYHDGTNLYHQPAQFVDVVDTCGAGDSFLARFIMALFFEETNVKTALEIAALHAGKTCGHKGGFMQPVQPVPSWLRDKYAILPE